jgi:Right handed beta helix region
LNPQNFITKIFQFRFPILAAMKHSLVFVLFLLALRCEVPAQARSPILVTDFGAQPDSHKDATVAFQRAISACRRSTSPVLVIPHGRYDFYPDSAIKKTYFVTNTSSETECPSKLKTIGLLFEGIRNLRVEGDNSLLVFHGKMTTIVVDHCDGFTLANLAEDFARPTMSEFTVTRASDTAIDVRVHPDSWHRIDSGRLTWYGEDWVAKDHFCIRVDTSHGFFYANDDYDRLLGAPVSEPDRDHLHFSGSFDASHFPMGSVFTVRDPIRDEAGVFLTNSRNIHLKNMAMHYLHGLGIVSQFSENITMTRVFIEPDRHSGRVIASFADGMHFSSCKGLISIDSCRFDGLHDDAINIHGVHLKIIRKPAQNQLVVRYMHPQTYGFIPYYAGDSVAFVHPTTLSIYRYGVVRSARMLSPWEILVTFYRPLPEQVRTADVIENITWTPRVDIRHCHVTGTNTRGFLITTRRRAIVEYNTFDRLGMSAILVADDGLSWFESGQVHDLTIQHNIFRECGNNLSGAAYAISIAPENLPPFGNPVHRNIRITGNRFICYTPAVLTAKSVEGLNFTGNKLERVPYFGGGRLDTTNTTTFRLVACRHSNIKNNLFGAGFNLQ